MVNNEHGTTILLRSYTIGFENIFCAFKYLYNYYGLWPTNVHNTMLIIDTISILSCYSPTHCTQFYRYAQTWTNSKI